MADLGDDDKRLAFDLHYAACLHAVEDLSDALNLLYSIVWMMARGNEEKADEFYAKTYQGLLEVLAADSENLTVTDEFKKRYEEQING